MYKRAANKNIFNLADALAEDVDATSYRELLAEVEERYGNPNAFSLLFDQIVESSMQTTTQCAPYLRAACDGSYELLVLALDGGVNVLPYRFNSRDDAANWLLSQEGQEEIDKIRRQFETDRRGFSGKASE